MFGFADGVAVWPDDYYGEVLVLGGGDAGGGRGVEFCVVG